MDNLANDNVEIHDIEHYSAPSGPSITITGNSAAGQTSIFAGVALGNYVGYNISGSAAVLVEGVFNDGGGCSPTCTQIADVAGTGPFSYIGSTLYPQSGQSTALISLASYQGNAALDDLYMQGLVSISGNASGANVLGVGLVGPSSSFFGNTSSPSATTEFLIGQEDPNSWCGRQFAACGSGDAAIRDS